MNNGGSLAQTFTQAQIPQTSIGRSAFLVAAGIFLSRISGLMRESVFAHFFGVSFAADAFRAALRVPNILQNLFGEGVLSASFIPVYAKLVAEGDETESGRVAGAIFTLLALTTSLLVVVGVLTTPLLVSALAPGFKGETRELTIKLVRVLFPGIGLLVLCAWCLGILNSHGKFFLSYAATVFWNAAMILVLLLWGWHAELSRLAIYVAWGSVAGTAVQLLVQLPNSLRLVPGFRLALNTAAHNVRTVIRNFFPAFFSRGVVQLSSLIDSIIASFLPAGSVASFAYAQTLSMLPVSLFGMSVSAAELPAMSGTVGTSEQVAQALRDRILASTRRMGFFVVPSAIAFLALGEVIASMIYQTGRFTHGDSLVVWSVLAGSAVGLVASTVGRLYSSAFYALRDTRTPLRYATVRVILTSLLGYIFALPLPRFLGLNPKWGVAGLTASAGIAGWIELLLLRRGINHRIGHTPFPTEYFAKLWTGALIGAAAAWGIRLGVHPARPLVVGALMLLPYGIVYLLMTSLFGIADTALLIKRILRIARHPSGQIGG